MRAVQSLLHVGRCTGKELERILGHLTFMCLLRREALSIISTCYAFIINNYTKQVRIWDQVRLELRQIISLLPLLVADCRSPWDTQVLCSDASEYGFGVVERQIPQEDVAVVVVTILKVLIYYSMIYLIPFGGKI